CATVFIEPRERLDFDLTKLLQGGSGLELRREWIALAPHLDAEIVLDAEQVALLGMHSAETWVDRETLDASDNTVGIDALIEIGLLVTDAPQFADWRVRDDAIRASHWQGLAATVHRQLRWQGIDT